MMTKDPFHPENEDKEKNAEKEEKESLNPEEKPAEKEPSQLPSTDGLIEFERGPETAGGEGALKVAPSVSSEHDESHKLPAKVKKKDVELKALKKENENLRKTVEEFKDKYLRKMAEMDNFHKRMEREKAEYIQYALSALMKELLDILDNFERALQSHDQADGKAFQEGVEMIYRQYLDMIRKKGVEVIVVEGKKFDPNLQHAVLTEESDAIQEAEVAEVLQKGYFLNGRLLRPVMVKVLIPKKVE